jgi:hypothetical protein
VGKLTGAAAGLAVIFAPGAWAAGFELAASGRVVVAAGGDNGTISARAAGYVDATWTLDSGLETGVAMGAAAQTDDAARFRFGPPGGARAPITGLGAAVVPRTDAKAALVAGYGFVRGGWGEASLGRDQGAGERFSLTLPTAFAGLGVADAVLDPTGRAAIRLVNAPSGAGAKVTASSVRLLGISAGASFATRSDRYDLSQGLGPGRTRLADIWEAGLSYARTGRTGVKLEAGLTHTGANAAKVGPGFGDLRSTGAGVRVSQGAWALGAAALTSNNGRADDRDYSAYGVSGTWTAGPWTAMTGYARADDTWSRSRQSRTLLGLSRSFMNGAKIGLAASDDHCVFNGPLGEGRPRGVSWAAEITVEL